MRSHSPVSPATMDWSTYYPAFVAPVSPQIDGAGNVNADFTAVRALTRDVTVADIGCGFGGLLVALAPALPDELLLGKMSGRRSPVTEV